MPAQLEHAFCLGILYVHSHGKESDVKQVILGLSLFFIASAASATCSVAQLAGNYSALLSWIDSGREGFITGMLEVKPGGGAVLRGASLTYLDGTQLVQREGSAVGRLGIARQCTGTLDLKFNDRASNSEVALISGSVSVAGGRTNPSLQGSMIVDIKNPAPNNVFVRRNLLGRLNLDKIGF